MYDETMLDELLTEYYDRTLLAIDNTPVYKFSRRHERAMKRIFRTYAKNTESWRKTEPAPLPDTNARRNIRYKRILVAAAFVFLALLTGFTIAHFLSNSFKGNVFVDNTQIFAANTENSPTAIEKKYVPTYLPEWCEQDERLSLPTLETITYYNSDYSRYVVFEQWVKSEFDAHLSTDQNKIEIIEIDEQECLIVDHSNKSKDLIELILDREDYIFSLGGTISKNEAVKIVQSIILENIAN